ncbi:MAG: hypothetical protein VKN72_04815 [Nostocales cyanobacterium 94392]|nr:hypothetical protein [Nostocales cyanobacterium 94392]
MKLYATITSDRASKGQGGNKFITIDLFHGDSKNPIPFADIRFFFEKEELVLMVDDYEVKRLKAKRQKSETDRAKKFVEDKFSGSM